MAWLGLIRDHIAANAEVGSRDFMEIPAFADRGGIVQARLLFGERLPALLDELTNALVA
jgi:type I restriction enzyme R subunit